MSTFAPTRAMAYTWTQIAAPATIDVSMDKHLYVIARRLSFSVVDSNDVFPTSECVSEQHSASVLSGIYFSSYKFYQLWLCHRGLLILK